MDTFLKILYLEDRAEDAEIVLRLLKKSDFRFESLLAMNQKEFLEALDSYEPDIILSDNSLPNFNASEALRIVQQRCINVPFILVTGAVSEEFAAQIIKLGADDYILKDRLTGGYGSGHPKKTGGS
jgi:two-component system, NarL family, sensor histidine kinase UhpB